MLLRALFLLCVLTCTSYAQSTNRKVIENRSVWEPPSVVDFPQSVKSTVLQQMVTGLSVGGLQVVLEKTELGVVQRRIGGTIGHRGDAGDSLSWLCFYGSDPHERWVLWLMSAEIDANTVGGFRWQYVENTARFDPRCQNLFEGSKAAKLPVALRLGTTEAGVLRALGQPSRRLGNSLFYLHDPDRPVREMNTLRILLRAGVVRTIEVWKSSAN